MGDNPKKYIKLVFEPCGEEEHGKTKKNIHITMLYTKHRAYYAHVPRQKRGRQRESES